MAETGEESVNEVEEAVADVTETVDEASENIQESAEEAVEAASEEVEEAVESNDDAADSAEDDEGDEAEAAASEDEAAEEAEPEPEPEPELPPLEPTVFRGTQKNPSVAIATLLAGAMTFAMGITDTFFAEATAWTFLIWGLLLLFSNLLDNYQTYELNNDGIKITNPVRFWYPRKQWTWDDIYRLDILVGRRDTLPEHADMHIYHELTGELIKDREDRKLDPAMAQIIIDRAGLQPTEDDNPPSVAELVLNRTNKFHWSESGSIA